MSDPGGAANSGAQKPEVDQSPATLSNKELSALFIEADRASDKLQRLFFVLLVAELTLLALAAIASAISTIPPLTYAIPITVSGYTTTPLSVGVLFSAGFIALALGVRIYRYASQCDIKWYNARAVAESAKSLAWRFAVGGRPFPLDDDAVAAKARLLRRLNDLIPKVARNLDHSTFTPEQQITPAMERLRARPLAIRQEQFNTGRIKDQEKWYGERTELNKLRGVQWHVVTIIVEILGLAGSLAVAFHLLPFSPQGIVAAIIGGIISWTQAKRYQDLYAAYSVTASELNVIEIEIANQTTEAKWSSFVKEAEEACSREHHLWVATHDS